jgi:uncharacterized protein DUF1565
MRTAILFLVLAFMLFLGGVISCGDDDDDSGDGATDDDAVDDDADDDDVNDDVDDDVDDDADDDVDDDVDDDTTEEPAVFVSTSGNDDNPGTKDAPKLTISAAIALAETLDKEVRVAQGQYTEAVATGVNLLGGYEDVNWTRDPRANITTILAENLNPFQYLVTVESTEYVVVGGFNIVNEDNGKALDVVAEYIDAPAVFVDNVIKGRVMAGGFTFFINNVVEGRFEVDWSFAKSSLINNLILGDLSVWMDEAVLVNNYIFGTIYGDFTTEKDGQGRFTLINNNIWNQGLNCLLSAFPDQDPQCILTIDDINACEWLYCTEANGNISLDPLLVDPANDDYHLAAQSPCVDAGVDPVAWYGGDLADYDFEGDARPWGAGWDIGADEWTP